MAESWLPVHITFSTVRKSCLFLALTNEIFLMNIGQTVVNVYVFSLTYRLEAVSNLL